MASACFGFSLYGPDWIDCVPGGTLISKGCREHAVIQFGQEKKNRVFCECRAESVDSAGVPTESVQCCRGGKRDSYQFSSRYRSSGGFVRRIERVAGVIYNSVTGVMPSWASCGVRASKGMRGSDDDAVPEISSD